LIDKVLSQEQGETITAEFSGWTNQGGEQFPARVVWKRNNQAVMEFNLNNVGLGPKL